MMGQTHTKLDYLIRYGYGQTNQIPTYGETDVEEEPRNLWALPGHLLLSTLDLINNEANQNLVEGNYKTTVSGYLIIIQDYSSFAT